MNFSDIQWAETIFSPLEISALGKKILYQVSPYLTPTLVYSFLLSQFPLLKTHINNYFHQNFPTLMTVFCVL